MTNEEYAIELAENISPYDIGGDNAAHYAAKDAALDAMEWKEQQLIDKCKEFCDRQTTGEYYNRRGVFQIDKYIDDMLNFIKGE